MRVLHVMEALEGGTSRHLRDLVRFTPDVEQHVAVPEARIGAPTDENALNALRAAGAAVHLVPMTRRPPSASNARAVPTIRRLARIVGADVVHAHSSLGGALGRIATWGSGIPRVYTPNGLATHPAALAVERGLGRLTDAFVAVSDSEAELVRRLRLVPERRLHVIPNGIDPDLPATGPDLRELGGVPADAPLVVSVGRLIEQKAPLLVVETLVRVLRGRPDAYALLIGDGSLHAEVDAALTRSGLGSRLRRLPVVPDVAAGLATATVVLLLSTFEGAPYVPLEAMRAGVPVIATDVVGTRDIVDSAVGGLVPTGDAQAAAAAVLRLLGTPDTAMQLGQAGRERVTSQYSAHAMGRRHFDLYCSIRRI
jgi:glycosyltransferase involved in cell wall biosynthesis